MTTMQKLTLPKQAKATPSTMRGTPAVPFTELLRDTILTHGYTWAMMYYCNPNKPDHLTFTEWRLFTRMIGIKHTVK